LIAVTKSKRGKMKLQFIKTGFLLLFVLIIPQLSWSQIRVDDLPESFGITEKSVQVIPSFTLDSIHPDLLVKEDSQLGIPNRFGVVQSLSVNIKTEGVSTKIEGKGTIWRYELAAPVARSLGVQFSTYSLPVNATLHIYNPSKTKLFGAFTSLNNKGDNYFAVSDFKGNDVIVEYFEPDSAEFSGEVVIGCVSMAYKDLSEEATTTRIGINCPDGDDWQVEKNSVCMISFVEGWYSYTCSGTLVNNVRKDGTPYFLTANHCISSTTVAKTLIAYFNYENSSCNASDASLNNSLSGATLNATNSTSDFTLLRLSETPPDEYSPYYAGWDATGDNPESGVCIHHPNGESKTIATENDKVYSYPDPIIWDDNYISKGNSHWEVYFNKGVTESGSSGSPFFDQNKRVVGQLHGGDDVESLYGKFSLSWASSSVASKQLKAWLDPDNTGTFILDGFGGKVAPKVSFASQMTLACVNNTVQLSDKSIYEPTRWLWRIVPASFQFVENTDSTTQNPVVEFLQQNKYTIELIAANNFGTDSSVVTDYIDVRDNLQVEFSSMSADTTICGCDVASLKLIGTGAYHYSFEVSDTSYLEATTLSDTFSLSLSRSAAGVGNFSTWVKVNGSHGTCVATDSLLLNVVQQTNDNIDNAAPLKLGRNATYSNHCGTVEKDEPSPYAGNCYSQISWCSGEDSVLNNSVWFSFYGPTNGKMTIDTHGFDTQVAVYELEDGDNDLDNFDDLVQVAANDNRSSTDATACIEEMTVVPGKQYWVQLDGRNGAYGDATIDLISNSAEVYPAVSDDGLFTLYISSSDEGTASYNVYNTIGQKVLGGSAGVTIDNDQVDLDLSSCPRGLYLLSVKMGNISSVHKIVVK
jgi:PKD repeat protein